jgi:glycosyltransferase involved in cell wall biosynthesis
MDNLKIAMILDNGFNPDQRVLREAQTLIQAGHSVTIFAWNREINSKLPDQENIEGINVKRIRVPTGRQLGVKQIPKYLEFLVNTIGTESFDKFDVIHCHDLPSLLVGVFLKIKTKKKLVYDAHEIYWIMESQKYPSVVLKFIKNFEIWLLKFVDTMITVSAIRYDYYKEHYKKSLQIIGNWHDPQIKNKVKGDKYRLELGIPSDSFVITYAGTLARIRLLDVIVECVGQLESKKTPIHWVFAGSGPLEKYMKEAARTHPTIHFIGWTNDLSPLYSASDALIYLMDPDHPYTDFNSPNNLFLSIAWAIPLVAVSKGDIADVLSSYENGILLDNASPDTITQAILRLSSEPMLYDHIVDNLTKLQEKYNWQICGKRLISLYDELFPSTQ